MIKQPVQRLKSVLRLIFGWKYGLPSGSHLIGQGYNLLCVAVVIDNVLVVKTVMHRWEPKP